MVLTDLPLRHQRSLTLARQLLFESSLVMRGTRSRDRSGGFNSRRFHCGATWKDMSSQRSKGSTPVDTPTVKGLHGRVAERVLQDWSRYRTRPPQNIPSGIFDWRNDVATIDTSALWQRWIRVLAILNLISSGYLLAKGDRLFPIFIMVTAPIVLLRSDGSKS